MAFAMVQGSPPKGIEVAKLDDIVSPKDLNLKLPDQDLEHLKRVAATEQARPQGSPH
jgi:hypothetical protein